jgi:signal transduction histidine kinase
MDVQAMDDAVTNLLSNAWKYKRGDRVRITVRTARRGRHAELLVRDDGVGIPREERRRVFEMFYRANQYLTHPVAGTGLGLALVRNVVRGHQGTVRVEAGEGGKGAAFRLRFPLDLMGLAAEEQAAQAALAPAGRSPSGHGPSEHGIVDDDNPGAPAS